MRDFAADPPLAIRVTGVGRTFGTPLGLARPGPGTFGRMLRGAVGLKVPPMRTTSVTAGEVLKDISFEIREGSAVCIAGGGNSAKSALLKLLAGVVPPTTGRIEMRGPVASILEIGENLEHGRTALENIENQRRLKRIPDADAGDFAAQVIAFAELGGFERVPVRKYSTGMQVRLSLALALQGRPAVVLMDDVLGVGDVSFQRKCVDRLTQLNAAGCTLVIAASDEAFLQLATRVITLGDGGIIADGPPGRPVSRLHEVDTAEVAWHIAPHLPNGEAIALKALEITERREDGRTYLDLILEYDVKLVPQRCRPLISIMQGKLTVFRSLYPSYLATEELRPMRCTVAIPVDLLPRGICSLDVAIVSQKDAMVYSLKANAAVALDVARRPPIPEENSSKPLVSPVLPWEIEALAEGSP